MTTPVLVMAVVLVVVLVVLLTGLLVTARSARRAVATLQARLAEVEDRQVRAREELAGIIRGVDDVAAAMAEHRPEQLGQAVPMVDGPRDRG